MSAYEKPNARYEIRDDDSNDYDSHYFIHIQYDVLSDDLFIS